MKKLITLSLAVVMLAAMLCACSGDPLYNNNSATQATEETTAAVATVDQAKYDKTFDGMQKYLIDSGLLYDQSQKDKKTTKTETIGEIIGAKNGVRYTLNSSAFVEFYEYGKPNKISKKVFEEVKSDGTFAIEGLEELTGVLSSSEKYMMVYVASIKYDQNGGYDAIINAFKQF